MAKSSDLVVDAKRIETLIDASAASGRGRSKRRVSLRRALLKAVACWFEIPDELRVLRFGWGRFAKRHSERMDNIAMALYAMTAHHISPKRAVTLLGVPRGDLEYVVALITRAESSLALCGAELANNPPVKSAVDSYFEDLVVSIDERALEDMLLATVESYVARSGRRGEKYQECYGWCLGYTTHLPPHGHKKRFGATLRIARVVTQLRARAGAGFVIPNDSSARAHQRVAARFFPHLSLLGDYHTHPYKSVGVLRNVQGWKYSPGDHKHIKSWTEEVRRDGVNPRFSLIAAVAKGDRSGKQLQKTGRNRWQIGVSDLFVEVAAYRILHDGSYDDEIDLRLSYLSDGKK